MSTPNLEFPEPLPAQTLPAGRLQAFGSEPEPYDVQLTADTNPDLGTGGVAVGLWTQQGAWVQFQWFIQFGSSGVNNGAGVYGVNLPPIPALVPFDRNALGSCALRDASAPSNRGGALILTGTTSFFMATGTGTVSANSPWTWAANDTLAGEGRYLAAF